MIDLIANEILISGHILRTNNVSRIAEQLGYRPLLILTALYRGTKSKKLIYDKKTDTIIQGDDIDLPNLQTTESIAELRELVEEFMVYTNDNETDITTDELLMFIGGLPELHIKIILFTSKKLTTYEVADPKDKKSVYTFITLKENLDKQWGKKQFDAKKSKARKFADKVLKEKK